MQNLNDPPADLMQAAAVLEANGIGVFRTAYAGVCQIVLPNKGRRDVTDAAVIQMAANLKPKAEHKEALD